MVDAEPTVEAELELGLLKKCLEVVTAVVDEGRARMTDGGVSLRDFDPAHVALVSLEVGNEAFVRYDFGEDEDCEITVDYGRLAALLKGQGGNDNEVVKAFVSNERLTLRLGNRISLIEYTLRLPSPATVRKFRGAMPNVPEPKFPCIVDVDAAALYRGIRAAERIANFVTIGVGDDCRTFFIAAEGYNGDALRVELDDENADVSVDAATPAVSKFSAKYLSTMLRAVARAADVVTLRLGNDIPLRLDFEFGGWKAAYGCKAAYLLAPRIGE